MARRWKTVFWLVAAILMGLFGAVCLSGFFFGAVETCSGLSVDGKTVSERCETDWAPVIYLTIFSVLSFVGVGLAVGHIRRMAREDEPRSERRRS